MAKVKPSGVFKADSSVPTQLSLPAPISPRDESEADFPAELWRFCSGFVLILGAHESPALDKRIMGPFENETRSDTHSLKNCHTTQYCL